MKLQSKAPWAGHKRPWYDSKRYLCKALVVAAIVAVGFSLSAVLARASSVDDLGLSDEDKAVVKALVSRMAHQVCRLEVAEIARNWDRSSEDVADLEGVYISCMAEMLGIEPGRISVDDGRRRWAL